MLINVIVPYADVKYWRVHLNKKTIYFILIAFAVFLGSFFGLGPFIQSNIIEPNQPYLIVDPEMKADTGCEYDYLTYIPVEITGRDPSEGIKFPVSKIPVEFKEYVHYPESWDSPLNIYNPANSLGMWINNIGMGVIVLLSILILVYLVILWRKGKLKKMADKLGGKDNE
jgi:hypothetical protein